MKILVLLALDIAVIAMEIQVLGQEWHASGTRILRYYTQNSNLWALMVCSICAVGELVCLLQKRLLPEWLRIIRYLATCCLMVTMIVAVTILVPSGTSGSFDNFMLKGTLLYLHTLCPLTMLLSWMVHTGRCLRVGHALLAIVPTIIYGGYTLIMNINRVYQGPYFFFEVHRQPLHTTLMWVGIIIGGNFALAWLLGKAHVWRREKR